MPTLKIYKSVFLFSYGNAGAATESRCDNQNNDRSDGCYLDVLGCLSWEKTSNLLIAEARFIDSWQVKLRLLKVEIGDSRYYIIFRSKSLLRDLLAEPSLTEAIILDAVYWNDALLIYCSRGCWKILANRASSLSAFWRKVSGVTYVGNRVVPDLLDNFQAEALDRVGWAEALLWDAPLRHRTLWCGLSFIPPGYFLRLPDCSLVRCCILAVSSRRSVAVDDLAREADELLAGAVKHSVDDSGSSPIILPLSGGLDSRGIALHLVNAGFRHKICKALAYGHASSLDVKYSRQVAASLGLPWQLYRLDAEHYLKKYDDVYSVTGGMAHLAHCHNVGMLRSVGLKNSQVIFGFIGDKTAGADCHGDGQIAGVDDTVSQFLAKTKQTIKSVTAMFGRVVVDQIIDDVQEVYRDCISSNVPCSFYEYFMLTERQAKLIAHIFNALAICDEYQVAYPYMDSRWSRFFLSLPTSLRKNRCLFERSLAVANQKFDMIPTTNRYVPLADENRFRCAKARCSFRAMRSIKLLVETFTNGKICLSSPYVTEDYFHFLKTSLNESFLLARSLLSSKDVVNSAVVKYLLNRELLYRRTYIGSRVITLGRMFSSAGL